MTQPRINGSFLRAALARLVLICATLPTGFVAAQDTPRRDGDPPAARPADSQSDSAGRRERSGDRQGRRPAGEFDPDDRPPPPWGPPPGRGGRLERLLSGGFEPGPEDRGPLQPGEADELRAFARERLPFVARMMNDLPPEAVERRMAEMAPRLRHLQRVFEENPPLGRKLVDHGRNMMMMQQLGERLRSADRPMQRRRIAGALRELNRQNFELEMEMLQDGLETLGDEGRRNRLIERYVDQVLEPDADLRDEPPPVRRAAERYAAAQTDEEREQVRTQMRMALNRRVDEHRDRLRDRYERRLADADREIERRTRDAVEGRPPRPPGGPRGPHASPPPP